MSKVKVTRSPIELLWTAKKGPKYQGMGRPPPPPKFLKVYSSKVYLSKVYFCEMYPTCVSSISFASLFLHKIWVKSNSRNAANITWRVYWRRNKCLLLSIVCNFQNPTDPLNLYWNGKSRVFMSQNIKTANSYLIIKKYCDLGTTTWWSRICL